MPEETHVPSPDQNDPTGHSREGSPTYHPGDPPSNNHRPRSVARPPATNGDEARKLDRAGVLERRPGNEPEIPQPSPPTGGPD